MKNAWAARFEAIIPPQTPYVPKAHLVDQIGDEIVRIAGAPVDARFAVFVRIEPLRDNARAPGWPFVDRRVGAFVFADRPSTSTVSSSSSSTGTVRSANCARGPVRWARVAWAQDEIVECATTIVGDIDTIVANSDYGLSTWGAATAAHLVRVREHAAGLRPRPQRPAGLGQCPDGRIVFVGWSGRTPTACDDSVDFLVDHMTLFCNAGQTV